MSLFNQLIDSKVPAVGYYALVENSGDIVINAKLFALASAASWLIAEFDPRTGMMFCYADLHGEGWSEGAEWGYLHLQELEALTWLGIPRVEFDKYFTPTAFRHCIDKEGRIIV